MSYSTTVGVDLAKNVIQISVLSNHMRGILLEFGVTIPQGFASLLRTLPEVLEDGENELPDLYRPTLAAAKPTSWA